MLKMLLIHFYTPEKDVLSLKILKKIDDYVKHILFSRFLSRVIGTENSRNIKHSLISVHIGFLN